LSESNGEILSASQSDTLALATICFVDGEFIAYQNANLISNNQYNLSWLVRGVFDTKPVKHNAGGQFLRLDSNIFKFNFTPDYIGKTIYIKLVAFNIYGGGEQNLYDVQPFAYTIKGTAYSSPLQNVSDLRTSYIAGVTQLTWDEISDFRPVQYEVRKGADWNSGQILGRVSGNAINIQGNDKYFVSAYSQPVAGLQVYSETPSFIIITGTILTSNVIASYDEALLGWGGTISGSAVVNSGFVQISATGNLLTISDYLSVSDILYYGDNIGNGIYEIPTSHHIDIGRVAACQVLINWASFAQKITNNILNISNYLTFDDLLDAASSFNTDVYPEIATSQDGSNWSDWQKYNAGSYNARKFKARIQLKTYDSKTVAYLTNFTFAVDAPDRNDHYINKAISSAGTTINWRPDGTTTDVAFNGGHAGATTPNIQVTILNSTDGDTVILSSVSLTGCFVQVLNAGVGVARNVNILAQGY
jgi:hypothetical protein